MSEELDEYELSSINGGLHVLFSNKRKWQKEDLTKIIGLLSRKIDLMGTTHYDISTLCQNVMRIERCRSFCVTFGLSLNVKKQEQPQTCDRVANVIRNNTQLLQHMQELIGMLNYFEQTYGFPTIVSTKSESLKDYLDEVKRHCMIVRGDLTTQLVKKEGLSIGEANHPKVKEFEKHEEALTDVISEIYHGIYMINMHDAAIAIIERYVKYLDQIIHVLQFQPFFGDDTFTDLDKCVLTPGCKMFNISREKEKEMTPIDILTYLKMKAERLLRLQQNMVINWEQQQKQAWMNASIHKNESTKKRARALLTDTSIPITEKDRLEMLARSGSMNLLLNHFVQPSSSSQYVHPGDQAKLTYMISSRVSSKRPRYSGGNGSRKTKRRHRHKRSRRK